MPSETTIKRQIETTVSGKYSDWHIGVTDDPLVRKAQLGNPLSWLQWPAESTKSALNILKYFKSKGMKPTDVGAEESGKYVYIFLI